MRAPCGVLTLATDFGLQDSYVGTMKGVILRILPDARMVDLTHQITAQDVVEASLVLENAYRFFPAGTVHVVVVDPGVGTPRRAILIATPEAYFVGPDNGTFTRVLGSESERRIFEISAEQFLLPAISDTFHGRDIFAPAAAYLASGVAPEEFGPEISDPIVLPLPEPRVWSHRIVGQVIYVDSFGNVITNVSHELWDREVRDRTFLISINGKRIDRVVRTYLDQEMGATLALFGSSELLEIAVAGGRADRRIGAGKGDTVVIDLDGAAHG